MNYINKILYLFLTVFFFMSCEDNKKSKIEQEDKCLYEWTELGLYHTKTDSSLIDMLGIPEFNEEFRLYRSPDFWPMRMALAKFLPNESDTILFKELFWKKDSLDLYIWFLKEDLDWISVDGVMYNPKRLEW